jgi:hypothetical protein
MSYTPLALPIRVLDTEGSLIAEGVADQDHPATFDLPVNLDPVYVRLSWPSGKTETQRVSFTTSDVAEVRFTDDAISQNEWSAWATPRLNEKSALNYTPTQLSIGTFDHVWLRLWKFENGLWKETPFNASAQYRNETARQVDFSLDPMPYMLQLGGTDVPWRLVSLPGNGRCRVLLTPNNSTDPRAEPVKIIVTGFRPGAETLLEFLSRDSLRAAKALVSFGPLAKSLLSEKAEDPIAAVAGAYFLLRTGDWKNVPTRWFENLTNLYQWIADSAVIQCLVMIRRGLSSKKDRRRAVDLLTLSLHRGVPIFSEGLSLMQEASSLFRASGKLSREDIYKTVEILAASQVWAGAAFGFYGKRPDAPSPKKLFGHPDTNPYPRKQTIGLEKRQGDPPLHLKIKTRFQGDGNPILLRNIESHSAGHAAKNRTVFQRSYRSKSTPVDGSVLYLGDIGSELVS